MHARGTNEYEWPSAALRDARLEHSVCTERAWNHRHWRRGPLPIARAVWGVRGRDRQRGCEAKVGASGRLVCVRMRASGCWGGHGSSPHTRGFVLASGGANASIG